VHVCVRALTPAALRRASPHHRCHSTPRWHRPDQTAMPSAVDIAAQQQGLAYCIPRSAAGLAVLAAGDSITQGSVPSKNLNHPYTIRMKQLLEAQLSAPVRAVDAGAWWATGRVCVCVCVCVCGASRGACCLLLVPGFHEHCWRCCPGAVSAASCGPPRPPCRSPHHAPLPCLPARARTPLTRARAHRRPGRRRCVHDRVQRAHHLWALAGLADGAGALER
jgi:hypothetical protein